MARFGALLALAAAGLVSPTSATRSSIERPSGAEPSDAASHSLLEQQARTFARLALTLRDLSATEVDAYFGPADVAHTPGTAMPGLGGLLARTRLLRAEMNRAPAEHATLRQARLLRQVESLEGLLEVMNASAPMPFAREARLIYGIEGDASEAGGRGASSAPAAARRALEALLPGPGALAARVDAFRKQFIVPYDRRKAVFERALAECRARTLSHWALPANEKLVVEWTSSVGSAWHRYDGNGHSTLQLNANAVAFAGSALDVACHEGYPGHHAQFAAMEAAAGAGGVPIEDTVVLLRSPVSMLREGAASYGVELAFPAADRLAFERDVLFPLAGLDPGAAEKVLRVNRLVDALSSNVIPILRRYRDGRSSAAATSEQLAAEALVSSPRALLAFVDELGPYVLGYTLARDRVRAYVDARSAETSQTRWSVLHRILSDTDVAALSQPRAAIAVGAAGSTRGATVKAIAANHFESPTL